MINRAEAIVCVDCKAGHIILIPLSASAVAHWLLVSCKSVELTFYTNSNRGWFRWAPACWSSCRPWPAPCLQLERQSPSFILPVSCLLGLYGLFYPLMHGATQCPLRAGSGAHRGDPKLRSLCGAGLVSHSPPQLKSCSRAPDTLLGSH